LAARPASLIRGPLIDPEIAERRIVSLPDEDFEIASRANEFLHGIEGRLFCIAAIYSQPRFRR
jgi:hypothetical protein